ncbi:MAG: DNA gyrase inhibitor YacG [Myxococcales bacterium]|nr:DNA gyrase inhibitor YacG [Myxococcales bacterium]MBL0193180.1 DNA gyrase inhibitor YacG [Myxococcales bacterium]
MSACPVCSRPAAPRAENPAAPFCGPRCKSVDLGRWLNEEYRVPSSDLDLDPDLAAELEGT